MQTFFAGPFTFTPVRSLKLAGSDCITWRLEYGTRFLAEKTIPATLTQAQVRDHLSEGTASFVREMKSEHFPEVIEIVDYQTDRVEGWLQLAPDFDAGLTPGIIDDRSDLWLRSRNRLRSKAVSIADLLELSAKHTAPRNMWMLGLLPTDVTTANAEEWRAPTSWEIRHLVGEGSLTGVTGAQAAILTGVTPQNFRKYTAAEGAKTRQSMSFSMWHLLLSRLEIKNANF